MGRMKVCGVLGSRKWNVMMVIGLIMNDRIIDEVLSVII